VKWSRDLKLKMKRTALPSAPATTVRAVWRPFVTKHYLVDKRLSDILTALHFRLYGDKLDLKNPTIAFLCRYSSNPLAALVVDGPFDYGLLKRGNGGTESVSLWTYATDGSKQDNITDWALGYFRKKYQAKAAEKMAQITKERIFHYVYAVLHDPIYVKQYAVDLRRAFPRLPLYADFWQWADWGKELMDLHLGYESVKPANIRRTDVPDENSTMAGLPPKSILKSDKSAGRIVVDSETRLEGIPAEAWEYLLGNRSAIDWVLDQFRENAPKDPTIREKFNTYRLADYKEQLIDLLARIAGVSVETVRILRGMKQAAR
jgi:predicted helicase